jgi:hypothetical protein
MSEVMYDNSICHGAPPSDQTRVTTEPLKGRSLSDSDVCSKYLAPDGIQPCTIVAVYFPWP